MNFEALIYAIMGGICFGTYPLFIRTPAVIAAKPKTIVFQLYKSTVVFISGFLFLIPRYLNWKDQTDHALVSLFVFNWWAVLSAVFWIPAGLFTIYSVPIIGMGLQVALAASTSSVFTFLIFWLVFGTKMRSYSCGNGCTFYLAPLYLFFTVAGMVALIFSAALTTKLRRCRGSSDNSSSGDGIIGRGNISSSTSSETTNTDNESTPMISVSSSSSSSSSRTLESSKSAITKLSGIILSMLGGCFASGQFAVVQQGKKIEEQKYHCFPRNITCPPALVESFDTFGSWYVSFGIGAMGVTVCLLLGQVMKDGGRCPNFHWPILKTAGVHAGVFWVFGNFFVTLAVVAGGNAVVLAQTLSCMIIVSGAWGLGFYKEGDQSQSRKCVWFVCAVWTVVCMILLGMEKQE